MEIIREGEFVDINGLKPLGASHFHHLMIPNEGDVEIEDFSVLCTLLEVGHKKPDFYLTGYKFVIKFS